MRCATTLANRSAKHTLPVRWRNTCMLSAIRTNNAIGAASGDLQGLSDFQQSGPQHGKCFRRFPGAVGRIDGITTGFIQSFTQDSAQRRYYQTYQIGEPYFQDDWKVTPRLTVNLGLESACSAPIARNITTRGTGKRRRFNATDLQWIRSMACCSTTTLASAPIPSIPTHVPVAIPGVVSDLGLVQCGVNGSPAGCMTGHLFNPAPRVGFAWDPTGDGKTSIRGGYGIFFEHGTGNEANTGSLEASSPLVLSMTQPLPCSYPCIGNVGYGAASILPTVACAIADTRRMPAPPAGSVFPLDVTGIPTKAIWPYAQQWSFGVQRELPHDVVANIAYVGSKGTHLTIERQLNQLQPLPLSENPFGPNEPLTLSDCTCLPSLQECSRHPGRWHDSVPTCRAGRS